MRRIVVVALLSLIACAETPPPAASARAVVSGDRLVVTICERALSVSELATIDGGGVVGVSWTRVEMPVPTTSSAWDFAAEPALRFAQEWRTEDPFSGQPAQARIDLVGGEAGLSGFARAEVAAGDDDVHAVRVVYAVSFDGERAFIAGLGPLPLQLDSSNDSMLVVEHE
jgi:hypothetical protein